MDIVRRLVPWAKSREPWRSRPSFGLGGIVVRFARLREEAEVALGIDGVVETLSVTGATETPARKTWAWVMA